MVIQHEETRSRNRCKIHKRDNREPRYDAYSNNQLLDWWNIDVPVHTEAYTGATFGPDRLSRWPVHKDNPAFEPCSDDKEELSGLPLFEVADPTEPQPLPIEEFVDQIDSWKGFFNGIAESIKDFEEELARADSERAKEKISL